MDHGARSLAPGRRLQVAVAMSLALCCGALWGQELGQGLERPDATWLDSPDVSSEWVSPSLPPSDPTVAPPGPVLSGTLPQHPLRHLGFGEPLQGTSWLNRPYYIGGFAGTWLGDELIGGEADQGTGFMGGYWLGSDLNHYWGGELRASLFYVNTSLVNESRVSESRNVVGDANLLYYPWGDARWRPYGSLGLGFGGFHFAAADNVTVNHTGLSLPVGFGVKYLCRNWLAMRLDIKDNIVFGGNRFATTNNWSFVGGVEIHWGRKSSVRYFPW